MRENYPAPGPASDPWKPYIQEAAQRFSIPEAWIRAVIHQESGGHEYLDGQPITSSAGAMGLMQLMPETYSDMQNTYGLGSDPYDPHDNILAGTGYIKILYRKYGAPAFLVAYNAGPQRLEDYLYSGRPLPEETVNYVANITPNLGNEIALTGPLAAYAGTDQTYSPQTASSPEYATTSISSDSPSNVAQAWSNRQITSVPSDPTPPALSPLEPCNPNAAYDPDTPCSPSPSSSTPYQTDNSPRPPPPIIPTPPRRTYTTTPAYYTAPTLRTTNWGVQVGAFTNAQQARSAASFARLKTSGLLQNTTINVEPTIAHGTQFWRARLIGLDKSGAFQACSNLSSKGITCFTVPPGH
ncbi:lytic transglycosylase domain-containing protein [Swingsia samuiensis]|nr:lytic transglycosylase domain-containing protein [Swingsia samuiensis]